MEAEWIMMHAWTNMECSDREFGGGRCGLWDFEKECIFENCPDETKRKIEEE